MLLTDALGQRGDTLVGSEDVRAELLNGGGWVASSLGLRSSEG